MQKFAMLCLARYQKDRYITWGYKYVSLQVITYIGTYL